MAIDKSKDSNKKTGKGETITELAHRHLNDKEHTTTDDELRNAKVELTGNAEEGPESLFEVDNTPVTERLGGEGNNDGDNKDSKKNKPDKGQKHDLPNPYEVLG